MDYIGSKVKLNDWIFNIISVYIPENKWKDMIFMDGCSGSGSTSKYAIRKGFHVISNDLFKFSSVIVDGFSGIDILSCQSEIQKYIDKINSISGIEGFFYKNYSVSSGRLYFTDENAKRIDATRIFIEDIRDEKIRNYLLYISLEGISSIMNTTGVQAAFLKNIKDRAKNIFYVKFQPSFKSNVVKTLNDDLINIVSDYSDILYIDPPYNNRQYGPNYHLYETFVRYDNPEIITEIAGLRNWHKESKSDFCSIKTCGDSFKGIIGKSKSKLVVISYSSDGLLSKDELIEIFKEFGKVDFYEKKQNRYKADTSSDRQYDNSCLNEFLFVLNKVN